MTSSPDAQFLEVKKVEPRRALLQSPGLRAQTGRARPLIAHITPTPQIEQGNLSPRHSPRIQHGELSSGLSPRVQQGLSASQAGGTPRIPLAELDQSQLSQRLFHSPSMASTSSLSPSLLLTNQLPASLSLESRRNQRVTDRHISDLKQQVEQLQEERIEQLQQELEEKEQQMLTLKSSVTALNAEYMTEINSLKQDCQSLEEEVVEKDDRFSKLEMEHTKSLKTIQGLRSYISTLAPIEEMEDLKAKLEEKNSAIRDGKEKNLELEFCLRETREELKKASKEKLKLEIQNKELKEQVKELSELSKNNEKIRLEARNLDESSVELLAYDKKELESENKKLKDIIQWKTNKFEEETAKLEEQVRKLGGLLEKTNLTLQKTNSQLREKNLAYSQLETELKTKTETMTTLAQKLERVGAESSSLSRNKENSARLEGYYSRLARSMGKCLGELNSLMDLANQVMDGGNPNLSVLLGVNGDMSLLVPRDSPLNRNTVNLTLDEKLVLVRQQMEEVANVQEEIKVLRKKIGDSYSDRLAANMSCVTQ